MNALKQLIKDMAAQQIVLKKERKTGSCPSYDASIKSNAANWKVHRNAVKITAALNLYHELRGSPYRHAWQEGSYEYKKDYEELKNLYTQP